MAFGFSGPNSHAYGQRPCYAALGRQSSLRIITIEKRFTV